MCVCVCVCASIINTKYTEDIFIYSLTINKLFL